MILGFPVLSKREGVIHGWKSRHLLQWFGERTSPTNLKDKPATQVDPADFLGLVREPRGEGPNGGKQSGQADERGCERAS